MSYDVSDAAFEQFLQNALRDEKTEPILDEANKVGLDRELLERYFRSAGKRGVWLNAERAIEAYNADEDKLGRAHAEVAELLKQGGPYRMKQRLLVIAWLLWGMCFLWGVLSLFIGDQYWPTALPRPSQLFHPGWGIFAGFVVFGILANMAEALENNKKSWAETTAGVSGLSEKLNGLKGQADSAVVEGMLKEAMDYIGAKRKRDYSLTMRPIVVRGLEEMAGATTYEIAREVHDQIREAMKTMQCGTIGIAGPRGVGKTTLLRSLSARGYREEGKPPERLSIFTSAPVKYEGRDFIAHILTLVCEQVLDDHHAPYLASPSSVIEDARETLRQQKLRDLAPVFGMMRAVGGLLLVAGLSVWSVIANNAPQAAWIKGGGLNPGPLLLWGVILVALGLMGRRSSKGARIRGAVPLLLQPVYDLLARIRGVILFWRRPATQAPPRPVWADDPERIKLVEKAQKLLDETRYQLSYSSGWTGSLKFPVAAETGLSSAVTLAKTQQSLPELMKRYREFVESLTKGRQEGQVGEQEKLYREVVIVIDEMDKLESDEVAHKFINEIKGIFGVPGCFYLISVSETAMSSFERRGIHFRDAFDSALDDLFPIRHLLLDESRGVLRRRVLGTTDSFMCFLQAFSGGLPRDLIRECRSLVTGRSAEAEIYLPEVVQAMVKRDLMGKLFAIRIAMKSINGVTESSRLFANLRHLEALCEAKKPIAAKNLLKCGHDVLTDVTQRREAVEASNAEKGRTDFDKCMQELGAYLYFSATILECFAELADPKRIRKLEESGGVEQLARAHQTLSIHAGTACAILSDVRARWQNAPPKRAQPRNQGAGQKRAR